MRQHLPRGLGRHAQQEVDEIGQHLLADRASYLRHGLDETDHQLLAATEMVQRHRALEIVVQPARAQSPRRLVPGGAQQLLRAAGQFVEKLLEFV